MLLTSELVTVGPAPLTVVMGTCSSSKGLSRPTVVGGVTSFGGQSTRFLDTRRPILIGWKLHMRKLIRNYINRLVTLEGVFPIHWIPREHFYRRWLSAEGTQGHTHLSSMTSPPLIDCHELLPWTTDSGTRKLMEQRKLWFWLLLLLFLFTSSCLSMGHRSNHNKRSLEEGSLVDCPYWFQSILNLKK